MPSDTCSECSKPILIQIFKGTGVCCERCRKKRDGDIPFNTALVHAPEPYVPTTPNSTQKYIDGGKKA